MKSFKILMLVLAILTLPVNVMAVGEPAGFWVDGDVHLHSLYSDGNSTPEHIKSVAVSRGLDFLILTDHSDKAHNADGTDFPAWDEVAALSDANFVFINGCEVSNDVNGHINCFPLDLSTFNRYINFTEYNVSMGSIIKQVRDAGGLAIVNHPANPTWTAYDWTSYNYDGIEIWNGTQRLDTYDDDGFNRFLDDLGRGKNTVLVGGSDNHKTDQALPSNSDGFDPALGNVKTSVFVQSLTYSNIIDAIRKGRVVVHDYNNFVDLKAYRTGDVYAGMVGDMNVKVAPGEAITFKLSGYTAVSVDVKLWYIKPGELGSNRHLAYSASKTGNFSFSVSQTINEDRIYFAETHHTMWPVNNDNYVRTGAIRFKVNGANNWNGVQGTWRRDATNNRLTQTSTSTSLAKEHTKAVTNLKANQQKTNFTMTAKVGIVQKTGNSEERIGIIAQKSFFPDAKGDRCLILRQGKLWLLDENNSWVSSVTFTYNTGDILWFKMKVYNDTVYGKVWKDGTTEPASWTISGTFSSLTSAGGPTGMIGLYAAQTNVWFDNVSVVDNSTGYTLFSDYFTN